MLTLSGLEIWADVRGYVVERISRSYEGKLYRYEWYRKNDHSMIGVCRTLIEVKEEILGDITK